MCCDRKIDTLKVVIRFELFVQRFMRDVHENVVKVQATVFL